MPRNWRLGRTAAAAPTTQCVAYLYRSPAAQPQSALASHGQAAAVLALLCSGSLFAQTSTQPPAQTMGATPQLSQPDPQFFPTVHIAPAIGWPPGTLPVAAAGLVVSALATGLAHPRWIYVLPNGDVLVAQSNAPADPAKGKGFWAAVRGLVMQRAGAGVPSADRITLLRDADGDGVVELRTTFLQGLHSPLGMALVGNYFYVANTDAVLRFPYTAGQSEITAAPTKVFDLPGGPINHHWTKNILASADGTKLYATVGSNSNVAENGMAAEEGRAAIWEIDLASGQGRLFATGLRNPNGLAWSGGKLWTVVNERDEIGNDLVPDFLTSVRDGAFYGWPYSYYGDNVDVRAKPPAPEQVLRAVKPDYALGAHVAPLGLAASDGASFAAPFHAGFFIGQHGSWNRRPRTGYNVVFVPYDGKNLPTALPLVVLSGFVSADGQAYGRPAGLAIDQHGGLLVADDVGNVVWRVTGVAGVAEPVPAALATYREPR